MQLNDSVLVLPFVGEQSASKLARLGILSIKDLLHHIPHRYIDFRYTTKIANAKNGDVVTLKGKIISMANVYTKNRKNMQKAVFADETGKINLMWFNQPFLMNSLQEGTALSLSGKVTFWREGKTIMVPEYEILNTQKKSLHTGRLIPIYPETAGISSKWLRARIDSAYRSSLTNDLLQEFLPPVFLTQENFLNFKRALQAVHYPQTPEEAQKGKERLALNELLFLELANLRKRQTWQENKTVKKLTIDSKTIQQFTHQLPFKLTSAQIRALQEILKDLEKEKPMNRLLQGDVGSGKTVVAAVAAFTAFTNGYQSLFMAPTQILAAQHFDILNKLLAPFKVRIALITSSLKKGDLGKIDIFVGTHALLAKKKVFQNVALVIIDEQHRFGVQQREHLIFKSKKGSKAPHVLTMTATPIPRTVALTAYGDLDLSCLDELPPGRKPVTTWVVPPEKRGAAYGWIEKEIKTKKTQAFVICPLIEESQKEKMSEVKAVTGEFTKIKALLPGLKIGLLHGKLKQGAKESTIDKFRKGTLDILVATPVVEVGIDIPTAAVMVIEAAERFGLASLHQLRGRVGRGSKKSYCLLFTQSATPKVQTRLEALKHNVSGFELAEIDLKMRGPGEVFGTLQHGFAELKIASWQDARLIKLAKRLAPEIAKKQDKL